LMGRGRTKKLDAKKLFQRPRSGARKKGDGRPL